MLKEVQLETAENKKQEQQNKRTIVDQIEMLPSHNQEKCVVWKSKDIQTHMDDRLEGDSDSKSVPT